MGISVREGFLIFALSFTCVSLGSGKYQKLCAIKESEDDCLTTAHKFSGGMGGWQKHDVGGNRDGYISEIVRDVGKILKKCNLAGKKMLKTEVQEIYSQVLAYNQ